MHPNVRLILKFSVTPVVIALVFALLSTGRRPPQVEELQNLSSPDGKHVARHVYSVQAGRYLTGDPAVHEVYVGAVDEAYGNQTLVFASEEGDYKIEWSDVNELRVTLSKRAQVLLQQSKARDVNIQYAVW